MRQWDINDTLLTVIALTAASFVGIACFGNKHQERIEKISQRADANHDGTTDHSEWSLVYDELGLKYDVELSNPKTDINSKLARVWLASHRTPEEIQQDEAKKIERERFERVKEIGDATNAARGLENRIYKLVQNSELAGNPLYEEAREMIKNYKVTYKYQLADEDCQCRGIIEHLENYLTARED